MRCEKILASGKRCHRKAQENAKYCWQHKTTSKKHSSKKHSKRKHNSKRRMQKGGGQDEIKKWINSFKEDLPPEDQQSVKNEVCVGIASPYVRMQKDLSPLSQQYHQLELAPQSVTANVRVPSVSSNQNLRPLPPLPPSVSSNQILRPLPPSGTRLPPSLVQSSSRTLIPGPLILPIGQAQRSAISPGYGAIPKNPPLQAPRLHPSPSDVQRIDTSFFENMKATVPMLNECLSNTQDLISSKKQIIDLLNETTNVFFKLNKAYEQRIETFLQKTFDNPIIMENEKLRLQKEGERINAIKNDLIKKHDEIQENLNKLIIKNQQKCNTRPVRTYGIRPSQ